MKWAGSGNIRLKSHDLLYQKHINFSSFHYKKMKRLQSALKIMHTFVQHSQIQTSPLY